MGSCPEGGPGAGGASGEQSGETDMKAGKGETAKRGDLDKGQQL